MQRVFDRMVPWLLRYGILPVLLALYGAVGFTSLGYDDEFFNINLITQAHFSFARVWQLAEHMDVHPPLSYMLDLALFKLLGSWPLVRMASGWLVALSLVYAINHVRKLHGDKAGVWAFILLGLNPSLLLWGASLRWYTPFVAVLLWLSVIPAEKKPLWLWLRMYAGLLVLGYMNYSTVLLALPVFILYWRADGRPWRQKLPLVAGMGVVVLLLYLYQLNAFFQVHFLNREHQIFSLFANVYGYGIAQLGNQGLFPVSVAGMVAIAGGSMLSLLSVYEQRLALTKNRYLGSYVLGVLFFLASGIAGKIRNYVVLSPWQGLWLTTSLHGSKRKIVHVGLAMVLIGNLVGLYNVAAHEDTSKSGWNVPHRQALEVIKTQWKLCAEPSMIATYDPVMVWHLREEGYPVVNLLNQPVDMLKRQLNCLVFIKTFAGSMTDAKMAGIRKTLDGLNRDDVTTIVLGLDRHAAFKHRLDPRYGQYGIVLEVMQGVDVGR